MELQLDFGPFSVRYAQGFLRYLCIGGHEIVRMVYFAVRDPDWGTLPCEVLDEQVTESPDGYHIRYRAVHSEKGKPVWEWQVRIELMREGKIAFHLTGRALASQAVNRAGLCVLHPIKETAGRPVWVTHSDGTTEQGHFPLFIQPDVVFENIAGLRWPLISGGEAYLHLEGDIFEMEDQRNWTDASFKTYCTPLRLPFPRTITAGDIVEQRLQVDVTGLDKSQVVSKKSGWIDIQPDATRVHPFPRIGAGHAAGQPLPDAAAAEHLRALALDHLRVQIDFGRSDWLLTWQAARAEGHLLKLPLKLALIFSPDPMRDWEAFQGLTFPELHSIELFSATRRATPDSLLTALLPLLRMRFPGVPLGAGSHIHFTDLNRFRFDFRQPDFICYAVNPQVHAFDDRSLTENMEALAYSVESARALAGNRPLHLSPVTLRPRFNPEATRVAIADPQALPYDVDARQGGPFAVTWVLGSLKYLSESGVEAITLFETHGMKGLLFAQEDTCSPAMHVPVGLFPVYTLLRQIQELSPLKVVGSVSSDPLRVSSWVLESAFGKWLFLANHQPEFCPVAAGNERIILEPYEVLRIPCPF